MMNNKEISMALGSLAPGKEWSLDGDNYENLIWFSTGTAPSFSEIQAESLLLEQKQAQIELEKSIKKAALLEKLGITEDEAKLLLS